MAFNGRVGSIPTSGTIDPQLRRQATRPRGAARRHSTRRRGKMLARSLPALPVSRLSFTMIVCRLTAETIEMGTYTTEVSSVSTAPIPDAMFEVPADYRVTRR